MCACSGPHSRRRHRDRRPLPLGIELLHPRGAAPPGGAERGLDVSSLDRNANWRCPSHGVESGPNQEVHLGTKAFNALYRRLSHAGFAPDFVRSALLPDWWSKDCEKDPQLLADLSFRVARFLNLPLSVVEGAGALAAPVYAGARLRHVRNIDADRLGPAIHTGLSIAAAVARSLRGAPAVRLPPSDAVEWSEQLLATSPNVGLTAVASDLWNRGIPVVHVELLPTPKFQGLACVVGDRPVILLGHGNDEPARLLIHAAHEAGHVANRHCAPDAPVVDEEDDVPAGPDPSGIEPTAESFAWSLLGGGRELPPLRGGDYRTLANEAVALEQRTHVDAGVLLWSYANRAQKFPDAQMALKALYRHVGARQALRDVFDRHVDLESASETDRALLRCVFLDPERDGRPV